MADRMNRRENERKSTLTIDTKTVRQGYSVLHRDLT